MGALACFGEKTTSAIVGVILVIVGIVFVGLGLTVLPIIGFIIALPAFAASYPLLRSAFKEACEYYDK
jgi:uncharacterized membrane protein YbaN (DUF454 family)